MTRPSAVTSAAEPAVTSAATSAAEPAVTSAAKPAVTSAAVAVAVAAITLGAAILGACGFSGIGEIDQASGNGNASPEASSVGMGPGDASGTSPADDAQVAVDGSAPCVSVPAGWTALSIVAAGATCSGAAPTPYLENPHVGGACACACAQPAANPCTYGGSYDFKAAQNGGACNSTATIGHADAKCNVGGSWSSSVTGVSGAPRPPTSFTCAAGTATLPALAVDATLLACPSSVAAGACVVATSGACIMHAGVEPSCPGGFDARHVVTAASDVGDARTCATCTCNGTATCGDAKLTLYTDSACTAGARTAIFDNTCRPFDSSNFSLGSYNYTAAPGGAGACSPAAATSPVGGSVTSAAQSTLCCSP